ncbi:MAG: hypothetical protein JSS76_08625 [Bacteroidetes bacterium]|nr:hypothetical protein [Bacteroidota bacterium]
MSHYLIDLSLFVLYLAVMLWSFERLPLLSHSRLSRRGLTVFFGLKLLFSVATVFVYTYYYTDRATADIYKYFDDSQVIYDAIEEHPRVCFHVITGIGYDKDDPELKAVIHPTQHFDKREDGIGEVNNRLVIRLHVLLRFLSHGNIYIHTLFFCFLSFIGCVALYRALQPFFEYGQGRLLILPIFLVPSILFWTSGMLKETLVMCFLGLLAFSAFRVLSFQNVFTNLVLMVCWMVLLYLVKPFIALSFLAAFYVMATVNFKGLPRIITILLGISLALGVLYLHQTFICEAMASLIVKRNDFIHLGLAMKAGSLADTSIREATCTEPLKLIPAAIYNVFLQPALWSHGAMNKLFGLENTVVLLLAILSLRYFKRPKRAKMQLAAFSLVFVFLNYAVVGITIPIIGALVRYKVFGLLFFLILVLSNISIRKFISDIKRVHGGENLLLRASKFVFNRSL